MPPESDFHRRVLEAPTYALFRRELSLSACDRCALSEQRTHLVIDRGNPKAAILLIGEAPGRDEDLEARPFVGRSGKLLDALFLQLGFRTDEEALIANVVKCRPPKNRPPSPQEASACRPYLDRQIRLMKPRFVALLGATAIQYFLPKDSGAPMKDRVGTFFRHPDYPGTEFYSLYHPAYILRDPRKKPLMLEHLRKFLDRCAARPEAG